MGFSRPKAICLDFSKRAQEIETNLETLFGSIQKFVRLFTDYIQKLNSTHHANEAEDGDITDGPNAMFVLLHEGSFQVKLISARLNYLFFCYERLLDAEYFNYQILDLIHRLLFTMTDNVVNVQDAFDNLVNVYANNQQGITESMLFSTLCTFSVAVKSETSFLLSQINHFISLI